MHDDNRSPKATGACCDLLAIVSDPVWSIDSIVLVVRASMHMLQDAKIAVAIEPVKDSAIYMGCNRSINSFPFECRPKGKGACALGGCCVTVPFPPPPFVHGALPVQQQLQ